MPPSLGLVEVYKNAHRSAPRWPLNTTPLWTATRYKDATAPHGPFSDQRCVPVRFIVFLPICSHPFPSCTSFAFPPLAVVPIFLIDVETDTDTDSGTNLSPRTRIYINPNQRSIKSPLNTI